MKKSGTINRTLADAKANETVVCYECLDERTARVLGFHDNCLLRVSMVGMDKIVVAASCGLRFAIDKNTAKQIKIK